MADDTGGDRDHRIDAWRQAGQQAAGEGGCQRGDDRTLQVGVDLEEDGVHGVTLWLQESVLTVSPRPVK
jgi:hypothetical protein